MTFPYYYITTPIYYVNDSPHIGHAYTTLACDVIARFKRLDGYRVKFLTGTDEHGQKIEQSARKANIEPKIFVDQLSLSFKNLLEVMNFSNDDFIRTTEERHVKFVEGIWEQMMDSDNIYLGKYSGWYAIRDEAFYSEQDIIDGKAPTGAEVKWVEEESYFFRLSQWQEKLLKFYEDNPDFIAPESRRNEVISFVKNGLKDISISRTSFSWGIKVPNDPKHVIYVWLDALFNYLSSLSNNIEDKNNYWPCDLHVIGKDILHFHAVYWPAFLMSIGEAPPKRIFAHGWWTNEGEKISKSLGNVIDPIKLVREVGVDYVRYFLLREIPFGNDGNYAQNNLISRVNAELVNNIGNLVNRVLKIIYRDCDGKIPTPNEFSEEDNKILQNSYKIVDKVRSEINKQELHKALASIISLGEMANGYIDKQAPWRLIGKDVDRLSTILYSLVECIRIIGILLQAFIPVSAKNILFNLGIKQNLVEEGIPLSYAESKHSIASGQLIPEPKALFSKL